MRAQTLQRFRVPTRFSADSMANVSVLTAEVAPGSTRTATASDGLHIMHFQEHLQEHLQIIQEHFHDLIMKMNGLKEEKHKTCCEYYHTHLQI